MTRYIEPRLLLIEEEPPATCSGCGAHEELRPYGAGGSLICFDCGMANEEETSRQFAARLRAGTDPETRNVAG